MNGHITPTSRDANGRLTRWSFSKFTAMIAASCETTLTTRLCWKKNHIWHHKNVEGRPAVNPIDPILFPSSTACDRGPSGHILVAYPTVHFSKNHHLDFSFPIQRDRFIIDPANASLRRPPLSRELEASHNGPGVAGVENL